MKQLCLLTRMDIFETIVYNFTMIDIFEISVHFYPDIFETLVCIFYFDGHNYLK